MPDSITAEQLAQRAQDVSILDERQLQTAWSELGTRNVSLAEFQQLLVRKEFLTNYQIDRLVAGYRDGFHYGDYKVLYAVGAGTFARVFRCTHLRTGELHAVKVLRKRYSNERESRENRQTIEQFRREGELGASLKHPNIVPIREVYSSGLVHYIVMEFVEGRNLRELMRIRKSFDAIEATRLITDVAAGLAYAYGQGVTHRDIKPSNVLVSSDGQGKLVDFGLAGTGGDDESLDKSANPRTIDYAGLERSTSVKKDDIRSDIFFVGCMYYQLLTGKPAIIETRDRMQRLSKSRYQDIPPILDVNSNIPYPLAMIVNKAIEFDPERRYQTPGEMLTELKLVAKRLESGEASENVTPDDRPRLEGQSENGEPRPLMVVESDVKMQNLFRDLLKRNGYRVLVTSDPHRAAERFQSDPLAAELVIFSTGTIGEDALETFNEFGEHPATRQLPCVLLLGEQHRQWSQRAVTARHRVVAHMPIKLRQLRQLLIQLLRVESAT